MTKKAMVIINPSSGKEKAEEYKELVLEVLKKEYENIDVNYTEKANDATKFAGQACEENYDLVVSMGGDGTVNEVINGLAPHERRPIYGILPLGTVNDLSQALKIPQNVDKAIEMLGSGKVISIDTGKINDQYFGNVVAVGRVPEAIHEVSIEEKSKLGSLAYYIKGAKRILEKDTFLVRLTFNEVKWEGEIAAILIGLTKSLGAFDKIFPNAQVDDGKLHVIVVRDLSLIETLKLTPNLLTEKLEDSENITYMKLDQIKIEALGEKEYSSDIDGDKGPDLPIDIQVLPSFLKVLVPNSED